MTATRALHRLSVEKYEQMIEHGILTELDRVELIRGEMVDKMTIGDRHAACVKQLNSLLIGMLGRRVVIGVQDPIRLADSRPEPDISMMRPRADFYASATPQPADILLLVEVADSTLDYDRDVKGPLYAENAIAEYWIANLVDDCIEVHRRPAADGTYGEVQTFRRGQQVAALLLPGITLDLDDILPP